MRFYMVGAQGFEPRPDGLKVRCLNRLTILPSSYRFCRSYRCPYGLSLKNSGTPNRIRTGVTAVKGQCPRPLDDGCIIILIRELTRNRCYRCRSCPTASTLAKLISETDRSIPFFFCLITQQESLYR